jgi:hypothetical protein
MRWNPLRPLLVTLLVAAALTAGAMPVLRPLTAYAASAVLDDAMKLYDQAKFDDAVVKVRAGIANGQLTGSDAINGRALIGRCLVKAGKRVEAKEAFKSILRQDGGFHLDSALVPPDEMEVFNMASKEVTAEQIEAGKRIPASLGFFFGVGSGDNKNLGQLVKGIGSTSDKFDNDPAFGGSVRFPIKPRWSLDLELARFHATAKDTTAPPNDIRFTASATPLVLNVYYMLVPREKYRVSAFVGAGPMLATRGLMDLNFVSVRIGIADEVLGSYFHGGLEGEYLLSPKFSISGRVLGRSASAKIWKDNTLKWNGDPTLALKDRKVDFSGFGAFVALRAYIGY